MVYLLKILKQKPASVLQPCKITIALLFFMSISGFAQESETVINTFPYTEYFQDSNGGWTSGGTNSSWEWGSSNPNYRGILKTYSRVRAWATNLNGEHNAYESSWVESPSFDFTNIVGAIRFTVRLKYLARDLLLAQNTANLKLQYKIGDGPWENFNRDTNSQDWFNEYGWTGFDLDYRHSITYIELDASNETMAFANQPRVKFRFFMNSTGNTSPGFIFDNVSIVEDTDGDGIFDDIDIDLDGDGLTNEQEQNIARGKTVSMSSILEGETNVSPYNATDGNTNGNFSDGDLVHTGVSSDKEWIEVDLGESIDISRIKIWNRTDCCQERLGNVYVLVSETRFPYYYFNPISDPVAFRYKLDSKVSGRHLEIQVNTTGRYVRLQKSGNNIGGNAINIAEI